MRNLKANWITKKPETRLYQLPVPIIGLTGGIACGKSTVAKLFEQNNIPVINADNLVKNIYQYEPTQNFIRNHFPEVFDKELINFALLRKIVFSSEENKNIIEKFIYAELPQEFKKAYSKFNNPAFIVYDVPLLFEKNLAPQVDVILCVYAKPEVQIARIIERDKCDGSLAQKIIDQQMSIEEKKKRSDLILENNHELSELEKNFEQVLNQLLN